MDSRDPLAKYRAALAAEEEQAMDSHEMCEHDIVVGDEIVGVCGLRLGHRGACGNPRPSPTEVAIKALEEVSALRTSDNFGWMEATLRAREITTRALTTIRAARELPGAGTEDSNLGSAPDRKAGVPSGPSPAAVANQRESTTVAGEGSRQADHIASAAAGPGEAPCRKVCKTCEGSGRVLEARWGGRVGTKQCPDCATPTPSTRPGTEPAR